MGTGKKTLLLDSNRAAVPLYHALARRGHEVWTIGAKPGEPLAQMCPHHVAMDYGNLPELTAFMERERFDFLVPGTNDFSYEVCAAINEGRYPGIDTLDRTRKLLHKDAFRALAREMDLPVPRVFADADPCPSVPVIVKPVDALSGRGITVVERPTPDAIRAARETAAQQSRSSRVIMEEFVHGSLHSHSAFLADGEIVADFIVREDCSTGPFTVDTSRVEWTFPEGLLKVMRETTARMARAMELTDGLIHTQFISDGHRCRIIEITRRCPGDLYNMLIVFSTGYPYADSYIAPFIGERAVPAAVVPPQRNLITRHTVTVENGFSLWGLQFTRPVNLRLMVPLMTTGAFIRPNPDGRVAILFFESSSEEEQRALYEQLVRKQMYRLGWHEQAEGSHA